MFRKEKCVGGCRKPATNSGKTKQRGNYTYSASWHSWNDQRVITSQSLERIAQNLVIFLKSQEMLEKNQVFSQEAHHVNQM